MLEKILDLLTSFFEKYFIQSLVSFVVSMIIYYFTPPDFSILNKFDKELYILTAFVISFLIIGFFIYILKRLIQKIEMAYLVKKQEKERREENIREYKKFVDQLKPEEKNLLEHFLNTNNTPVILLGEFYGYNLIMHCCDRTEFIVKESICAINIYNLEEGFPLNIGMKVSKYKLKKEIYDIFMYLKKSGIGISNFDE